MRSPWLPNEGALFDCRISRRTGSVAESWSHANMKKYTTTSVIDASPETVWAILTNEGGYPEWNPEIIELELEANSPA
jgi:hypothetical protein